MPTHRPDYTKPSLAERLVPIGAKLQRLISAGFSARAEAVIPARLSPRDRRCG